MIHDDLGKKAEQKIREWLDKPEQVVPPRYVVKAVLPFKRTDDKIVVLWGLISGVLSTHRRPPNDRP